MAAQDFISIGLDVSGFTEAKMKKLNEAIAIFEKLSKYDGMKISPITGDGLIAFNKSLSQTKVLLDDINNSIAKLNSSSVKFSVKPDMEPVKRQIKILKEDVDKSHTSIENMGKSLTKGLSLLRSIAYILPGIGIAGIFNLAFEAIGKTINELGYFVDAEKEAEERTKTLKTALDALAESYKNVTDNASQYETESIQQSKDNLDLIKSRGIEQGKLLNQQLEFAKQKLAIDKIGLSNNPSATLKEARRELDEQGIKVKNASDLFTNYVIRGYRKSNLDESLPTKDEFEKRTKSFTDDLNKEQNLYNDINKMIFNYTSSLKDIADIKQKIAKFNSDQNRKLYVESAKLEIDLNLAKNKKILSDDRNLYEEQKKSIKEIAASEISLSKVNRINVTGTKKNPNLSATDVDIKIAKSTEKEEIKKAKIKEAQELEKVEIEFYQRRLKALTEINKYELDLNSINNEKVYKNEEKTLEERLVAYRNYIYQKQQIQDYELLKDIQRGAATLGTGKFGEVAKTSLTDEEKKALKSGTFTQKSNIQADVEKQVYEIVYSSLKKQLKTIVDFNSEVQDVDKAAYAKELRDLNKKYENQIFTYEAFKKSKEQIDKKYGVILSEDAQVEKDKKDILNLQSELTDLTKQKEESDKALADKKENKDIAEGSGLDFLANKRIYDEEVGRNNALKNAILDSEKEIKIAKEKGDSDELKAAQKKYEQLIEFRKEYAANMKSIEESLFNLIKTSIDAETQYQLEALARKKETQDEGFDSEINAIEKSTLTAKDKAALDIQLTQQKLEYDKNADREERKLKSDQAILDRELDIAHVLWDTQAAVMSALKIPPPAGEILASQRALLGGIAVATIMATPIPSYEQGTDNHPGGWARTGEKGKPELVKEPYKAPYWVTEENVSWLPKGTEVVPFKEAILESNKSENSWEQFRWLAGKLRPQKQKKSVNIININLGHENYKKRIFGN